MRMDTSPLIDPHGVTWHWSPADKSFWATVDGVLIWCDDRAAALNGEATREVRQK